MDTVSGGRWTLYLVVSCLFLARAEVRERLAGGRGYNDIAASAATSWLGIRYEAVAFAAAGTFLERVYGAARVGAVASVGAPFLEATSIDYLIAAVGPLKFFFL